MPELPEVETVCRALRPHLLGKIIRQVEITVPSLREPLDLPALRRAVKNRKILDVRRRAKFIIVELTGRRALLLHLGMTGAFRICPLAEKPDAHDRVLWTLSGKRSWRLHDPRRFGCVKACRLERAGAWPAELDYLGPEPLGDSFNTGFLFQITRKRQRSIKLLLMDQKIVAGIGNIYASEALFRAGVRPGRACGRLTRRECRGLVRACKAVLRESIQAGGTTISDFRSVDGSEGRFKRKLDVYGRADEACHRCRKGTIRRIVQGGRSTYYCPRCQR